MTYLDCTETLPKSLYAFARIGRSGLGNELFPLARAIQYCRESKAELLTPRWRKIRFGPYLRHEADKRNYHKLFVPPSFIAVCRREYHILNGPVVQEEMVHTASKDSVVVFTGVKSGFASLDNTSRTEVRKYLIANSRTHLSLKTWDAIVHVRLGDYSKPGSQKGYSMQDVNIRLPMHWYEMVILRLLSVGAKNIAIISDGTSQELSSLLKHGVVRYQGQNTLHDLLSFSSAKLVVCPGSSFSAWGAFMGNVAILWYPGRRLNGLELGTTSWEIEDEADGSWLEVASLFN